jgi:hypothetical protein
MHAARWSEPKLRAAGAQMWDPLDWTPKQLSLICNRRATSKRLKECAWEG